jgi:hypothetical protein
MISLRSPLVSRRHCALDLSHSACKTRDTGAGNTISSAPDDETSTDERACAT